MRYWPALLLLLVAGTTRAQVSVELILDQEQFLRDESMPVGVRIINRSGQPLELGRAQDWLTFVVETPEGRPVSQRRPLDLTGPFTLESAAAATKHLDLMPAYEFGRVGRFRLQALVKAPGWDQPFVSKPRTFDIGRGVESWSQEFGVPSKEGRVEVRRYALLQANYRTRPMLYARVTDVEDQQVFGVVPLGPVVSFSRPEKIVDRRSRLHVLFQTGAQSFLYCEVDPAGQWVTRQTFSFFRSRPTLRNEEGRVVVSGGMRRLAPDDFPAPDSQPSSTNVDSSIP